MLFITCFINDQPWIGQRTTDFCAVILSNLRHRAMKIPRENIKSTGLSVVYDPDNRTDVNLE